MRREKDTIGRKEKATLAAFQNDSLYQKNFNPILWRCDIHRYGTLDNDTRRNNAKCIIDKMTHNE
jgi:hypothetical protein